jgi:hypothetical protein
VPPCPLLHLLPYSPHHLPPPPTQTMPHPLYHSPSHPHPHPLQNAELVEEVSRYRMRPSDTATQVLGLGLGEAPDSALSSRRTSHLSLAPSLAATTGGVPGGAHSTCVGSSAGGSTVVSPTLSPRPEGTPRTSVDG